MASAHSREQDTELLRQFHQHAGAFREAVIRAGPDLEVPTCPDWTARQLVAHLARVHDMVVRCLNAEPGEQATRPPEEWDALVAHLDERRDAMVQRLTTLGPDVPTTGFLAHNTPATWLRRQAHEVAIHRLDAEASLPGRPSEHHLVFEPDFAADGVDELLGPMLGTLPGWDDETGRGGLSGTVLYHAADAGRAWLLRLRSDRPPEVDVLHDSGTTADATVAGTAEAVYRYVWGRPSSAMVGGDAHLAGVTHGR